MTKDEILKIKEHIEIHARREHRAIIITEILWKAVDELEHIKELKKENKQLKQQIEKMKCCENCKHHSFWGNELKCNLLDYDTELECLTSKNKWELING